MTSAAAGFRDDGYGELPSSTVEDVGEENHLIHTDDSLYDGPLPGESIIVFYLAKRE